ncbi:hypothetical protein [Saccharospirillum salsuginis]|uniref:Outer membrane protein beta-barrel domain-containing protein n=1 Tax=Saccharospirillum salsuginis TaxID=418750 RepID=A0A918NJM6_9GAMM|nr:hypothetical protein [Saccharospirillum salsuginis]GGX72813.1 hypothetical protein GCM10007392_45180 [Saccharospirillum salsuginis]
MKRLFFAFVLTLLGSSPALAEGLSDGSLELSINVIRSEGASFEAEIAGSTDYPSFMSAPIRLGYQLNDQFTLFGGFARFNKSVEQGNTEGSLSATVFTGGAQAQLDSGLMIEASWSRILSTSDDGTQEADFKGNHFEVFAGRRFQALNGLYIEPKAGGTFGSVELDDSNTDQSFQDGLGTEFALTLGYVL